TAPTRGRGLQRGTGTRDAARWLLPAVAAVLPAERGGPGAGRARRVLFRAAACGGAGSGRDGSVRGTARSRLRSGRSARRGAVGGRAVPQSRPADRSAVRRRPAAAP